VKTPFIATAVWLRDAGNGSAEVLVEIDGKWRVAICEFIGKTDNTFSHIAEGNGEYKWPEDALTKVSYLRGVSVLSEQRRSSQRIDRCEAIGAKDAWPMR